MVGPTVKKYTQTIYLVLFAFTLLACSTATPATPAPQPTPSKPSEGLYPLTTRTGIEEVDKILDVVASGDIQMLLSLIQFTNTRCTTAEGLGGPPKCREGEAEGTPVEVLPILGSEGYFFYREDIDEWSGINANGLYAVYEVSPEFVSEPDYPSGKYVVMFVDQKNATVVSLRVDQGKIVRVDYLLDTSPEQLNGWLEREASTVILPPLKQ
jgi:hypothetical protein